VHLIPLKEIEDGRIKYNYKQTPSLPSREGGFNST
jgi:hypothetical protein